MRSDLDGPGSRGSGLHELEAGLTRLLSALLWTLLVVVLAGAAFIVVRWAGPGTGSQGEWFYFGIGVLLLVGWLAGQLARVRARARERSRPPGPPLLSLRRGEEGGVRSWELRFGSGPTAGEDQEERKGFVFSRTFAGPARMLPPEAVLDEAALERIRAELAAGKDLDQACDAVQIAYRAWDPVARAAYRQYAGMLLDQRRGQDR
jgi:hypothetical protein